ncbi:MAG TPA: ATP-binding protein [Ktedonobacterales bacterium]|nr:ATP-binding protein [Ktedonobacterales bacterium]
MNRNSTDNGDIVNSLRTASRHLAQRVSAAVAALRQQLPGGWRVAPTDPSTALFGRIRLRLILWYASVLAVVLLIVGGLLYVSMRQTVMGPVNEVLTTTANAYSAQWRKSGTVPCLPTHDRSVSGDNLLFVTCYDSSGTGLISVQGPIIQAPGFLDPSLAQRALNDGSESDVVDGGFYGGYDLGAISRYALVVHAPGTNQVLGVVQVGVPAGGQIAAMQALLRLLLILGPLALLGATLGGFFLAERALAPARLAFTRQQQFIADASHELRTPLTLLRADAEVLLRGRARFSADDAALLEDIVKETEHLSGIANNLLTLARLDSGAIHLERDIVDLATIARDAARRVDALAREQGIAVRLGELTSVTVLGDAHLLAQAALALLDNALKYAGRGSEITLTTSREDHLGRLTVHDTGPGIAAEHLPLLGQRFYRPDKSRSRAIGGAGLGLSVVRGILALHHGSLTLESAPGKGTSAILRIPAISLTGHASDANAANARDQASQRA